MTGDLKWMAMLLGMDDMSGEWCIYCMLRKKQWLNNEVGQPRTIKKLVELAKQNLRGPMRMGVKFEPYWPFIPVENYAVPLLHIIIGVFNDIIDHFTFKVDSSIIEHSIQEKIDS